MKDNRVSEFLIENAVAEALDEVIQGLFPNSLPREQDMELISRKMKYEIEHRIGVLNDMEETVIVSLNMRMVVDILSNTGKGSMIYDDLSMSLFTEYVKDHLAVDWELYIEQLHKRWVSDI